MNSIDIEFGLNAVLLFFLVVTAIGVVSVKNLLLSTILLSIFSLLMAVQYLALGAPDVAITEAAVGAGVSTILILMALSIVGDNEKRPKGNLILPLIIVGFVTASLLYITADLPAFGSADNPSQKHLIPYYFDNTQRDTGIPNMVTSILASYRGYDTLGETAVVFTAALAVLLLIGKLDKNEDKD